jgi:hypothetical protein
MFLAVPIQMSDAAGLAAHMRKPGFRPLSGASLYELFDIVLNGTLDV